MVSPAPATKGFAVALVLGVAAVGALSGCGSSDEKRPVILNTEQVETAIERSILDQRKLKSTVTCPAGVEQKKGNSFRCEATTKGRRYPFVVKQTDDNGHVSYVAP